jgi:hypothetical protein
MNTKLPARACVAAAQAWPPAFPWQAFGKDVPVSDACNSALTDAINKALEGVGLEAVGPDRGIALSNPWERREYDYWNFDHLTDGQAGWFIAGKIREVLGQRPRIASEERARRENLSARVISGELDDVHLYVRRNKSR